eukprot:88558_1
MVTASVNLTLYSQYISSISGIIICIALLLYHWISTVKAPKTIPTRRQSLVKTNNKTCSKSLIPSLLTCSFLMLIFGIIYSVTGLSEIAYTDYISNGQKTCYIHFVSLVSSYGLFKMFMYIGLSRRLIESFEDSMSYSYSSKYLYIWELFVIFATIALTTACAIFIKTELNPSYRPPCNINFPNILLILLVAYDFLVCVVNLVLFLKPLYNLTDSLRSENKTFYNKFKTLIKKNALLASISITTSFVAWIVLGVVSGIAIFVQVVDITITSLAILLLFNRNQWIYDILCCNCGNVETNKNTGKQKQLEITHTSMDMSNDLPKERSVLNTVSKTSTTISVR